MTRTNAQTKPTQSLTPSRRSRLLAATAAITLLSLLVVMALAETALRLSVDRRAPETPQSRSGQFLQKLPGSPRMYGLKPNVGPPVHSNSFGFRGRAVEPAKAPGTFRIVMLGDSITYGNSVDWDQTFSHVLETQLNDGSGPSRIEVLNLGVSGYNTQQQLGTLRELGLRFSPDLVVLNICLNDSDPVKHLYGLALRNETRIATWSDVNIRTIVDSSYVLTLVKHRLGAFIKSLGGELQVLNSPGLFLDSRLHETAWGEMKETMREMRDLTASAGLPLAAVIYPYSSQVSLPGEARLPQQDLLAFFRKLGVPVLDIAPAYQDQAQDMFVDAYLHLSPYGHRVVADALRAFLAQQSLLPSTTAVNVETAHSPGATEPARTAPNPMASDPM